MHLSVGTTQILVGVSCREAVCLYNFKEMGGIAIFFLPSNYCCIIIFKCHQNLNTAPYPCSKKKCLEMYEFEKTQKLPVMQTSMLALNQAVH